MQDYIQEYTKETIKMTNDKRKKVCNICLESVLKSIEYNYPGMTKNERIDYFLVIYHNLLKLELIDKSEYTLIDPSNLELYNYLLDANYDTRQLSDIVKNTPNRNLLVLIDELFKGCDNISELLSIVHAIEIIIDYGFNRVDKEKEFISKLNILIDKYAHEFYLKSTI